MERENPLPSVTHPLFVNPVDIGRGELPTRVARGDGERTSTEPAPTLGQKSEFLRPKDSGSAPTDIDSLVRSYAMDGVITQAEAIELIKAFNIEKRAITRETREKWYALSEDYRINLQNALGVKADGKIAKNGDGKTIGKIRRIARGEA